MGASEDSDTLPSTDIADSRPSRVRSAAEHRILERDFADIATAHSFFLITQTFQLTILRKALYCRIGEAGGQGSCTRPRCRRSLTINVPPRGNPRFTYFHAFPHKVRAEWSE
jgi:hypothetical protein